jgi:hypothetical protein
MPHATTKHLPLPLLMLALAASTLAMAAAASSALGKAGGDASPAAAAHRGQSEVLLQAPCGSTTEGGPEGPAMQANQVCTGGEKASGPVTEPAVQDPDRYAWRIFSELNQPAPGHGRKRVWQAWANQLDVFVSRPDPNHPPTWAVATGTSRRDRFQRRVELMAALSSSSSSSSSSLSSSSPSSSSPSSSSSSSKPSSSSSPSSPSSSSSGGNSPQPRYDAQSCDPDTTQQVFLNRPQFEYVVSNHLWYVEGQIAAFVAQKRIQLPTDAKVVKALWRPIAPADRAKYYWTESKGKLYGLASFLFISKVSPTWVWASFEHVDNPCFARYEAPQDSFGVTAAGRPSLQLLEMFRRAGLDPALWSHYRLGGVQTSFTNTEGRPVLLGNSIAEDGFQTTSSCATCHSRATVGPHTNNKVFGAGRLPIFSGFYAGNGQPQSASGAPDPSLYDDFSVSPPTRKYLQMDFSWSFACANEIGSDSNPCAEFTV